MKGPDIQVDPIDRKSSRCPDDSLRVKGMNNRETALGWENALENRVSIPLRKLKRIRSGDLIVGNGEGFRGNGQVSGGI